MTLPQSSKQVGQEVQALRLAKPGWQLYCVAQPALAPASLRRTLMDNGVSVVKGTPDEALLEFAAQVLHSPDNWLHAPVPHAMGTAIQRAALWWCLTPLTAAELAVHLYANSRVEDSEGQRYLMQVWDSMVLRALPAILKGPMWDQISSPLPLILLPDANDTWLVLDHSNTADPQSRTHSKLSDEPLRLSTNQMDAMIDLAETGQAVGFVRERMPEPVARHNEYDLHRWAKLARRVSEAAGYAKPADAKVLLAAHLELAVLDDLDTLEVQMARGRKANLPLIDSLTHFVEQT
jgi:hypothetical protein